MNTKRPRVAILGPRGTFSEEATIKFLGEAQLVLVEDIADVFESLSRGRADFGIAPVENSLEGSVAATLELLLKGDVKVYGEVILDIRHALLACHGVRLSDVKEVLSHPHALAQCRNFIREHRLKTRNFSSTAEAAMEIAEKKPMDKAAIASRAAGKMYGLKTLKEDIQDEGQNQTRFLVLAKDIPPPTGRDKTSIVIELKDKPGALHEALGVFAARRINLTRIESRPSRKALGDYIFHIDLEGHVEDDAVADALEELGEIASFVRILGSYPKG